MLKVCFLLEDGSLLPPTDEFCREHGMSVSQEGIPVCGKPGNVLSLKQGEQGIEITYRKRCEWFRALTYLPQFLKDGIELCQKSSLNMLCYLADASRNAVYNLQTAKTMIRFLAGMGYDSMMLYTEDTYEIPEYPYFGRMRGRFSKSELRELDAYSSAYGIELIPCIQTLAHLSTALRWPDFDGYRDTSDILMVGDERTYRFIDAELRQCADCFHSRKINIGMDEAHLMACGEYLKKNGYRNPSDVMLEHLERVTALCHEYGFSPMMWSDMFFNMAFHGAYYVTEGSIPDDIVSKVPKGLDLIYWDYCSLNKKRISHMLECHRQFPNQTVFAGGAWKWSGFGAHNAYSIDSAEAILDECEKYGVDRVIVTSWGDDGGEASQFSSLASCLYFAERCFHAPTDRNNMNRRAEQCFGCDFDCLLAFDLPDSLTERQNGDIIQPVNPSKYLLYNDPLERLLDCHMDRDTVAADYANRAETLLSYGETEPFGYAFHTLGLLCRVLSRKSDMGWRLADAYRNGNREVLKEIAETEILFVILDLQEFLKSYRSQWYRENKPFGFQTQEIRIGGLMVRLESVRWRLLAYLEGTVTEIPELEEDCLPLKPSAKGNYILFNQWKQTVSAGVL